MINDSVTVLHTSQIDPATSWRRTGTYQVPIAILGWKSWIFTIFSANWPLFSQLMAKSKRIDLEAERIFWCRVFFVAKFHTHSLGKKLSGDQGTENSCRIFLRSKSVTYFSENSFPPTRCWCTITSVYNYRGQILSGDDLVKFFKKNLDFFQNALTFSFLRIISSDSERFTYKI